jgi:hypothetical protein
MTAFQQDPIIEELKADHREAQRKKQQALDDDEHAGAFSKYCMTVGALARELPPAEEELAALGEKLFRTQREFFAKAAMWENRKNELSSQRMYLGGVLARTMPACWRQARTDLEERLAAERQREIGAVEEQRTFHNAHVVGLLQARDAIDQLIGEAAEEMPRKIAGIFEAIPPRYDGGPIKVASYIEQQATGIREYLKSRFRGDNI